MRVAVSGYVGPKITGIGRNLIELLSNTDSTNDYILFVNEDMVDDFASIPKNVELRICQKSKNDSLGNLIWTTFSFPQKAKEVQADVALIPNFTLLLFKCVPTVVIMHDLIEFNIKDKFSKLKMFYRTKLADPITAAKADSIITVSENSKKDLIKFLNVPTEKIHVINDGVDREKFYRMNPQDALKVLDSHCWPHQYILYVGTVDHPGKNAYTVIKAFELACDRGYPGNLILAGMPGSGFNFVEKAVNESRFVNRIVITGYVNDSELVALYSLCEVFCFVSLYEGFGVPPLEALACGAKVIVSNTSSLPEVVGNMGATVDPVDTEGVVQAMLEGIGRPTVNELELSEHLLKFDWAKLAENFETVLRQQIEK
jgi:glycosyltransferase involved in cell wall biosynthesis